MRKQQDWGCSARDDSQKLKENTSQDSVVTDQDTVPKQGSLVTVTDSVDNPSDHQVNVRWQVKPKCNP